MADTNPDITPNTSNNGKDIAVPGEKHNMAVEVTTTEQERVRSNLEEFERLFGVDEDAYEQPTTTRKELWSYYLYYNGSLPFGVIASIFLTPMQATTVLARAHIVKHCRLYPIPLYCIVMHLTLPS